MRRYRPRKWRDRATTRSRWRWSTAKHARLPRSPAATIGRLSFSREYDVRRARRRHMLGARIAQRRQVDPRKERLTTAEPDRRDRDVHFVDEARLEIFAHRGRPAADLDIAPTRGLRSEERRVGKECRSRW